MLSLAGIAGGIALLIGGGALLVRGASEIATRHNISPIIVGLVIVGFGTSSPELVVNIIGAATGAGELAFGNAVGSNIANLGLILGITACLVPITIQSSIVRRELPLLLLATTMILVLALDGPIEGKPAVIGRSDSVVLLLVFTIFVYISALDMIRVQSKDPLLSEIALHTDVVGPSAVRFPWLMVLGGFVLLYLGGEVTIRNSVAFAAGIGIPAAIVGLFVVSLGTSMPELVTSIIAALRNESDLALGNVVGSNIFNSLVVLPVSGLIGKVNVPAGGIGDLVMSWVFAAILIPIFFLGNGRLGRPVGALILVAYLVYAVVRLTQNA
jgi:cation:H+ antiporter